MTLISTTSEKGGLVCSLGSYGESDKRALQISHGDAKNVLTITFERTLRVPDNKDVNFLPPSLGRFPLFSVAQYKKRLPPDMAAKGGIFFPMMQREAMWMQFSAQRPFAVKIYVGGVNAISGVPMTETPEAAKKRLKTSGKVKQDYVVLPDQPWLDGIATEDGQIRQFVAMPKGSGYSVEAQVTGEEKIDGIQFEVTPVKLGCHDVLQVRYTAQPGTILNKTMQLTRVIDSNSTVMDLKKLAAKEFGLEITDQIFNITGAITGAVILGDNENSKKLSSMYFPPTAILNIQERPKIQQEFQQISAARSASGFQSSLFSSKNPKKSAGSALFGSGGPPSGLFGPGAPPPPPAPLMASAAPLSAPHMYDAAPFAGKALSLSASMLQPQVTGATPNDSMFTQQSAVSEGLERSAVFQEEDFSTDRRRRKDDSDNPAAVAREPEVKAMGLAAGGLIQQSINVDNYPASLWDPSSTILFNVQLLNWEAFHTVTGRAPPDAPLDAKTYAQHNMPFFQIWNEEKTGVKGDFAKVKSIGEIDESKAMEKDLFWATMKGESGTGPEAENVVGFERDESLEFPIVLLHMSDRTAFKPIKEMEADLAKLKLDG